MSKALWMLERDPQIHLVDRVAIFERLADDGWPEDAGSWPISGNSSSEATFFYAESGSHSPAQFIKAVWQSSNQVATWLVRRG